MRSKRCAVQNQGITLMDAYSQGISKTLAALKNISAIFSRFSGERREAQSERGARDIRDAGGRNSPV